MRVFTATLGTETNTFAPMPTGIQDFQGRDYDPARTRTEDLQAFGQLCRALRERSAEAGWSLIEGKIAFAVPSGITTRRAYEFLRDQLLADLAAAMPLDMVLLQVHGAMIADGYEDAEGDLLARVRALVGRDVLLGAELDPHCHLTELKVASADLLVLFKEYPHTDIYARARDLVRLAEDAVAKRTRPVMGMRDLGFVTMIHTSREPGRGLVDRMTALEGRDGVLSVSLAHSFPWGDCAEMGARLLVVTDGDTGKAEALCGELGDEIIAMKSQFAARQSSPDEAITRALASNQMAVVLADGADNPGAGAGGDSTFILQRLLERKVDNAVMGPFWDPVVVGFCRQAGVGARLDVRLGGKVSRYSGAPVDASIEVVALAENAVQDGLGGSASPLGDVAVVRVGGVTLVVNTLRTQAFGPSLFTQFGIDLARAKLIVVKSMQHFHAAFAPIAGEVIYVDTPGSAPADFQSLTFKRARRSIWPFSEQG